VLHELYREGYPISKDEPELGISPRYSSPYDRPPKAINLTSAGPVPGLFADRDRRGQFSWGTSRELEDEGKIGPQVAVIEPIETGALKRWTPQGETAVDGTPVELVNTLRKTVQNKPRGCGVCSVCFLSMAIGWTPGRVESWRGSSLELTLSGSKEHSCKKSPFLWITQIGSSLFAGVSQRTFTDQVRARPDRSSLR
jgi:hypothetical protein